MRRPSISATRGGPIPVRSLAHTGPDSLAGRRVMSQLGERAPFAGTRRGRLRHAQHEPFENMGDSWHPICRGETPFVRATRPEGGSSRCRGGCCVAHDGELVERILRDARRDVLAELDRMFTERRRTGYGPLYDLLADYPFREGKGLRPAICLSACRASGGTTDQACCLQPRSSCSTTRSSSTTTSRTARRTAAARQHCSGGTVYRLPSTSATQRTSWPWHRCWKT